MDGSEPSNIDNLRNLALIASPFIAAVVAWGVAHLNISNDRKSREEVDLKRSIAKIRGFIGEIDDFKSILEDKQGDVSHAKTDRDSFSGLTFSDLASFTSIRLPEIADYIDDETAIEKIKVFRQDVRDLQNSLERFISPKCSDNDLDVFDEHFIEIIGKTEDLRSNIEAVRQECEVRIKSLH